MVPPGLAGILALVLLPAVAGASPALTGGGAGGSPESCSSELSTLTAGPATADLGLDNLMAGYGNSGQGWSGSDGGDSVNLPGGRTVWLYDDTYLGLPVDHHRTFLHNTMVVQQGAKFRTLYNTFQGKPVEYMNYGLAPKSSNWYWSYGGIVSGNALYVAYGEYHYQGGQASVYGFVHTSTVLAAYSLSTLRLESVKQLSVANGILWGVWLINFGAYTYIYGSGPNANTVADYNSMYVARVAVGHLADIGSWQYYTGTGNSFVAGAGNAGAASTEGQSQFSVTHYENVYVLTTMKDVFEDPSLMLYFSCSPYGFGTASSSPGIDIYDTLGHGGPYGTQGITGVYTYGACAHLGLTSVQGRLVITYDVNSSDWSLLNDDLNIVRPRYIETTISL